MGQYLPLYLTEAGVFRTCSAGHVGTQNFLSSHECLLPEATAPLSNGWWWHPSRTNSLTQDKDSPNNIMHNCSVVLILTLHLAVTACSPVFDEWANEKNEEEGQQPLVTPGHSLGSWTGPSELDPERKGKWVDEVGGWQYEAGESALIACRCALNLDLAPAALSSPPADSPYID